MLKKLWYVYVYFGLLNISSQLIMNLFSSMLNTTLLNVINIVDQLQSNWLTPKSSLKLFNLTV